MQTTDEVTRVAQTQINQKNNFVSVRLVCLFSVEPMETGNNDLEPGLADWRADVETVISRYSTGYA